ncbi:MAG: hypothetical protein ACK4ZJ_15875, partial [Allorhizobium sp.]
MLVTRTLHLAMQPRCFHDIMANEVFQRQYQRLLQREAQARASLLPISKHSAHVLQDRIQRGGLGGQEAHIAQVLAVRSSAARVRRPCLQRRRKRRTRLLQRLLALQVRPGSLAHTLEAPLEGLQGVLKA